MKSTKSFIFNLLTYIAIAILGLTNGAEATSSCEASFSANFSSDGLSVTTSSTKDLSHVILYYCDSQDYDKFDNLNVGKSHTFTKNRQLRKVKIKAGCSEKPFYRQCKPEPKTSCAVEYSSSGHAFWFSGVEYVTKDKPLKLDEKSDGTALLSGTIVRKGGSSSDMFDVSVALSSWTKTPDQSPKNPFSVDTSSWRYYLVLGGEAIGTSSNSGVKITFSRRGPAFQIGVGANDKSKTDLGASSWFNLQVVSNTNKVKLPFDNSDVGDINLKFIDCPTDCEGTVLGSKVVDSCGVCGGDGSSCVYTNVCRQVDGEYKVVSIPANEKLDSDLHPSYCRPVTICLGGVNGVTKTVTWVEFWDLKEQGKATLGECLVGICEITGSSGKYAQPNVVIQSVADQKISEGSAVKGECEYTKICRFTDPDYPNGKIETVATITLETWLQDPKTYTDLSLCEPKEVCEKTHESCVDECLKSFDPLWAPTCVANCNGNCGIYCDKGDQDCVYEKLDPTACSEANGFLSQVNIASVINLSVSDLKVDVQYRDLSGNTVGSVSSSIPANTKQDFIVNELGLLPDTYGTVCVVTDAADKGMWRGGVTLYKQPSNGLSVWGGEFEFALYYPFKNPTVGFQTAPLNTFALGGSKTANWIRVTDAVVDNNPLMGTLFLYNQTGNLVDIIDVVIPDGGRFDFSGHDPIGSDTVGTALFAPKVLPGGGLSHYYFTTSRYFYNCKGDNPFACSDFLSAFAVPDRRPIKGAVVNTTSTLDDYTVLELNNPVEIPVDVNVSVFNKLGELKHNQIVHLERYQTHHLLVHGILSNEVGYTVVDPGNHYLIALAAHYKKQNAEVINYGYSTPFTKVIPELVQMSEFNSFLNQQNDLEIVNTGSVHTDVVVTALDYTGSVAQIVEFNNFSPGTTSRVTLNLPLDSYGTIIVDGQNILVRNYVTNISQYSLPFIGK